VYIWPFYIHYDYLSVIPLFIIHSITLTLFSMKYYHYENLKKYESHLIKSILCLVTF